LLPDNLTRAAAEAAVFRDQVAWLQPRYGAFTVEGQRLVNAQKLVARIEIDRWAASDHAQNNGISIS
jgi:hypothetical protein